MPRRRGPGRIARGVNIAHHQAMMAETTEKVGKERYAREFVQRGLLRREYYMEMVSPYVAFLSVHPDLSREQRQAAVKEFYRRFREQFENFLASCADAALRFATTFVTPVAERAKKPAPPRASRFIV